MRRLKDNKEPINLPPSPAEIGETGQFASSGVDISRASTPPVGTGAAAVKAKNSLSVIRKGSTAEHLRNKPWEAEVPRRGPPPLPGVRSVDVMPYQRRYNTPRERALKITSTSKEVVGVVDNESKDFVSDANFEGELPAPVLATELDEGTRDTES